MHIISVQMPPVHQHLAASTHCIYYYSSGVVQYNPITHQNFFRCKEGEKEPKKWELSGDYYQPAQFERSVFDLMRNSRDNYEDENISRHTIILFRPQAEYRTLIRKYSLSRQLYHNILKTLNLFII